jgi:hypothetical protein
MKDAMIGVGQTCITMYSSTSKVFRSDRTLTKSRAERRACGMFRFISCISMLMEKTPSRYAVLFTNHEQYA